MTATLPPQPQVQAVIDMLRETAEVVPFNVPAKTVLNALAAGLEADAKRREAEALSSASVVRGECACDPGICADLANGGAPTGICRLATSRAAQGGVEQSASPEAPGTGETLSVRLVMAQVASCNCDTKTHETAAHLPICRYRVLSEAHLEIERLTQLADKFKWQVRDTHTRAVRAEEALSEASPPPIGAGEGGGDGHAARRADGGSDDSASGPTEVLSVSSPPSAPPTPPQLLARVPDGWQLVPKALTADMAAEMECATSTEGQWFRALEAAPTPPDGLPAAVEGKEGWSGDPLGSFGVDGGWAKLWAADALAMKVWLPDGLYRSGKRVEDDLLTELREALRLVLPLAKGYAAANRVGSNATYCQYADEVLAKIEVKP